MTKSRALALLPMSVALCAGMSLAAAPAKAEGACTPGKDPQKSPSCSNSKRRSDTCTPMLPFFKKTAGGRWL